MSGTTVARGNCLRLILLGPTLTPVAVAAAISAEQAFTVTGLRTQDIIYVVASVAQTAGIGIGNARVSANDTLQISFMNATAGSLTPAAGIYQLVVHRPENLPIPTVTV
jgi:hypothetical protein